MESISIGIHGHWNKVELYDFKVLAWRSIIQKTTEFRFQEFTVFGCFMFLCNFCSTYQISIRVLTKSFNLFKSIIPSLQKAAFSFLPKNSTEIVYFGSLSEWLKKQWSVSLPFLSSSFPCPPNDGIPPELDRVLTDPFPENDGKAISSNWQFQNSLPFPFLFRHSNYVTFDNTLSPPKSIRHCSNNKNNDDDIEFP